MAIDAVGTGLIVSFLLLYRTRIADLSLGGAGVLLSVTSGLALVANPVAGSLVDRFGPRALVVVSQGLGAALSENPAVTTPDAPDAYVYVYRFLPLDEEE